MLWHYQLSSWWYGLEKSFGEVNKQIRRQAIAHIEKQNKYEDSTGAGTMMVLYGVQVRDCQVGVACYPHLIALQTDDYRIDRYLCSSCSLSAVCGCWRHGCVCLQHKWINLSGIKQSGGILYKLLYQNRGQWIRSKTFIFLLTAVPQYSRDLEWMNKVCCRLWTCIICKAYVILY